MSLLRQRAVRGQRAVDLERLEPGVGAAAVGERDEVLLGRDAVRAVVPRERGSWLGEADDRGQREHDGHEAGDPSRDARRTTVDGVGRAARRKGHALVSGRDAAGPRERRRAFWCGPHGMQASAVGSPARRSQTAQHPRYRSVVGRSGGSGAVRQGPGGADGTAIRDVRPWHTGREVPNTDRVVLITGATGVLGRETARVFADGRCPAGPGRHGRRSTARRGARPRPGR